MMDSEPIFRAVKEQYPKVLFLRTRPSLPASSKFEMDAKDAQKMKTAMEQELDKNPLYRNQITDSAGIIAVRMIKDFKNEHLSMISILFNSMISRQLYDEALYIARAVLERIPGKNFL